MMKKPLLFFVFLLFVFSIGFAQVDVNDDRNGQPALTTQSTATAQLQVFPNPASNFIGLSDSRKVNQILIYNVVGRRMMSFQVREDELYNITDLPTGMYLVQFIGANSKVITTQRLSKR